MVIIMSTIVIPFKSLIGIQNHIVSKVSKTGLGPQHHFRSVSWRFKSETRKFKLVFCSSLPDLLGLPLQLLTHQGPQLFLPFQQQLKFSTAVIISSLKTAAIILERFLGVDSLLTTDCWLVELLWQKYFTTTLLITSLHWTADKAQLSIVAPAANVATWITINNLCHV